MRWVCRFWWPEAAPADPAPAAAAALRAPVRAAGGAPTPAPSGATLSKPSHTHTPTATLPGVTGSDPAGLEQAVTNCQACRLCCGRRAPVFSAAAVARRADCLVLGEPPDENEERLGLPFVGQGGQLLDNMLRAIKLHRSASGAAAQTAYLSNVVKCRPAVARNPGPQELAACEIHLQRELALVQPKVILALGRFAAQLLLQAGLPEVVTIPLGKLRGKIYQYQGVPVVVSYHPVYLLRTPQDKARAWADLCLVLDLLQSGLPSPT